MSSLPKEPPSSEITPEPLYLRRREFIRNTGLIAGTAVVTGGPLLWLVGKSPPPDAPQEPPLSAASDVSTAQSPYDTDEQQTSYQSVTTYNNFYEFGTSYGDAAENAHTLQTRPWTISVEGEVAKPQTIDIDDLLKWF